MSHVDIGQMTSEEFYKHFCETKDISLLRYASEAVRDDKDLIMKLMHVDAGYKRPYGEQLKYLSERLRDDEEVVLTCVELCPDAFKDASERLRGDVQVALKAISFGAGAMSGFTKTLLDDKQVVMEAFNACEESRSFIPFELVSDRLRDDEEVAFLYCREGYLFPEVSERLRDNEELVLLACETCERALKYASERIRRDWEFAITICSKKIDCLTHMSDEIKDNWDIMTYICMDNFEALEYASERLKRSRDFVWPIIREYPEAYIYIHLYHNDDDEMAWYYLDNGMEERWSNGEWNFFHSCYFSPRLMDDRDFVKALIMKDGREIEFASPRLKNDLELCRLAMRNGAELNQLGEAARSDYDLVLKSVLKNGDDLRLASEELKNNMVIALAAIHNTIPYVMSWRADDWWGDETEDVFRYVGEDLKKDEEFARIVIKAFMQTYYREKYDQDELMKDPCRIFEIIPEERDKYEFFEDEPEQKLDLSEILSLYIDL